ncbi:hypothetical protein D3874_23700 [Oleomonas cavernae]|uniref:Uncharacterized protein n=1 Tax=Oleomonas cavernae TaxID=2320859 RepID=A0A418WHX8_9PROT|nr:hypothetical protein D3874_23700 [Oleomonas cavernae]
MSRLVRPSPDAGGAASAAGAGGAASTAGAGGVASAAGGAAAGCPSCAHTGTTAIVAATRAADETRRARAVRTDIRHSPRNFIVVCHRYKWLLA